MNILQKIFNDYYEVIKYTLHPRDSEMENIDKMLNCGDPSFGGAMYVCTTCHNMKFVSFRCKSRFCPSCGVKYSQERSTRMAFKLLNCTHRHCVFTIYARHRKIDAKLYRAIHQSKHRFIKGFTKWRQDILLSFGYDPLFCPHCKKEMALIEVYYRHKRISLQELYERTMAKVKCRSA